jgi:hypothetical protein
MRVRMQSSTGDYVFGGGSSDFWINSAQGVEQLILTGLRLWQGTWFLNAAVGMPWLQSVIGFNTQSQYDAAIQAQVLQTTGVSSITNYRSSLNAATRHLTVTIDGVSLFGQFSVSTSIALAAFGFGITPFGNNFGDPV